MKQIRILLVFVLIIFLALNATEAKQAKSKKTWITARSFAVIDIDDGRLLYARKPYQRLASASTVKVMTALVVLEHSDLNRPVIVSKKAAAVQPTKAYLTAGATYSTYDLLQALLISSANDAACALAENVAGSEWNFARLMNEKARKIGMKNTYFVNASGLPTKKVKQYSTAYDLAILMRYAVRNKTFVQIISKKSVVIMGSDGKRLYLNNHNKLLKTKPKFVIGKTGYTLEARHCFIGTDYAHPKNIAFAILYSRNLWQDIRRLTNYGLRLKRRKGKIK